MRQPAHLLRNRADYGIEADDRFGINLSGLTFHLEAAMDPTVALWLIGAVVILIFFTIAGKNCDVTHLRHDDDTNGLQHS